MGQTELEAMNNVSDIRGAARESALSRDEYFSDHYFSMLQLCTQSHQIHDIHKLRPTDIIEVGIGNGFTSSFLRAAGYDVTTADINADLRPDISAPLSELPSRVRGRKFDLAVCCEVLEHMPFEIFEESVETLRQLSPNLYLTIPNYSKFFGFSGYFDVPRLRQLINLGVWLPIPRKITPEHFWEINSRRGTSRLAIRSILERHFARVVDYSYKLNRYHHVFVCTEKGKSSVLSL